MAAADTQFVCGTCGYARIRVPSGRVCPNGHGRVWPPGTPAQVRRAKFLAWRETLPEAVRVPKLRASHRVKFRIGPDCDTLYVYLDFDERCTPETIPKPGQAIAKVRCGKAWLVRRFMAFQAKKSS